MGFRFAGEDLVQTRLLRGPRAEPIRSQRAGRGQSVARGVAVAAPSWSAEGWGAVGPQKTWRGAPAGGWGVRVCHIWMQDLQDPR